MNINTGISIIIISAGAPSAHSAAATTIEHNNLFVNDEESIAERATITTITIIITIFHR